MHYIICGTVSLATAGHKNRQVAKHIPKLTGVTCETRAYLSVHQLRCFSLFTVNK